MRTVFLCIVALALALPASAGAATLTLQSGTLMQMTILRIEPDPLVIVVDHFTRRGLREIEKATAPVLESLQIGV